MYPYVYTGIKNVFLPVCSCIQYLHHYHKYCVEFFLRCTIKNHKIPRLHTCWSTHPIIITYTLRTALSYYITIIVCLKCSIFILDFYTVKSNAQHTKSDIMILIFCLQSIKNLGTSQPAVRRGKFCTKEWGMGGMETGMRNKWQC
jgi:hypothetical protein